MNDAIICWALYSYVKKLTIPLSRIAMDADFHYPSVVEYARIKSAAGTASPARDPPDPAGSPISPGAGPDRKPHRRSTPHRTGATPGKVTGIMAPLSFPFSARRLRDVEYRERLIGVGRVRLPYLRPCQGTRTNNESRAKLDGNITPAQGAIKNRLPWAGRLRPPGVSLGWVRSKYRRAREAFEIVGWSIKAAKKG